MLRRVAAAIALGVVVTLATAGPVGAHAELESTDPPSGAVLDDAPSSITLRYTEPVEAGDGDVKVVDSDGERVDAGTVGQPDGRTVVVALDDIDDGGFVVAWRVVSADGHPIGGGFTFRVGDGAAAVDAALVDDLLDAETPGLAAGIVHGIGRFLAFGGAIVLVGAAAFVAALWPAGAGRRRTREVLWVSWVCLLAGTAATVGTQWSEVKGLETAAGQAWVARLALLAPVALLIAWPRVTALWWRVTGAAVGVALVGTFASSGHAGSGRWVPLSQLVDIVHVGSGAVWIGGIVVLLAAALRRDEPAAATLTARFSTAALACVALVVATGSFQSVRQVVDLDVLETAYGRLLVVKVVVVLVLIGIAALTRSAVRGRLPGDGAQPVSLLRRLVAAEAAVAVAVIGVTALLVDANPNATAASSRGPFDETRVVDDVLLNVVVVPGTVGPTDVHLYVDDPAGGLEPPLEASATLSLDGEGIDGIPVALNPAGPGHWSAYDVDVPLAGEWSLTIEVLLTEFDNISTTFTVPIGESS